MSVFIELVGKASRNIPSFRGKGLLAQKILAPFLRRSGHEVHVDMKTPGGGMLICNLDDLIPWNVYIYGSYWIERNYEKFLLKTSTGCNTIFDIGANIGYYSVQFGRVVGNDGEVHSFEPCSYQFEMLNRNLRLNGLDNVVANKLIVTDQGGVSKKIYFSGMSNTGSSSLEVETGDYEKVDCITLDAYCDEKNIKHIDTIKIDVEGHELGVLKGMEGILRSGSVTNIFLEINNYALTTAGTSAAAIIAWLKKFHYRPYSISGGEAAEYVAGKSESLVYFSRDV